ncbi:MAG TPA: TonB-dependent receptor [Thermoanaerobaculia bacterium]|nr:TonB-dependent receptor [Thermoanaerobaculia bacterium]
MKSSNLWGRAVVVAALLLLVTGGSALAQLESGNLYGTVSDTKHAALPGVTVTLSGNGAPMVQVTNAQGQFRFLSLAPARYNLSAQLEGFSTVEYPNISIAVGRNTTIEVTLQPAIEETITVTTESPLLDERKISAGSTVTKTELEKIPTSRDPWSILQQVPGVLTDRINVGGNESGQQSAYVGPGSGGDQAVWAVDGVVITDMGALGSSPTYYDFDAFEEMQVTTGGTDATIATGGVVLNMVTKRGTNEWRGSGRYLDTRDSWQSNTSFNTGELGKPGPWNTTGAAANGSDPGGPHAQKSFKRGNRIVDVKDYGGEVGGPIVKDKLWIWGAWGTQRVSLLTIADVSDKTQLATTNGKLNAQFTSNNSATAFYLNGNKQKQGRNAGPTRPQETTWNQTGPTDVYKVEDTQIFSSNFFLTGLASYVKSGFSLTPQGGLDVNTSLDSAFVFHNSFLLYDTVRPQHQYKVDASNFFNTGSVSHELKFGAGYRDAKVTSLSRWSGFGLQLDYYTTYGTAFNIIELTRDAMPAFKLEYKDVYAQDTLTSGNLTVNFGVRYDTQGGNNLAESVRANPAFPTLLPALHYNGGTIGYTWKNLTPRLGLTYALGAERKTLLRASYSRFADQLGGGTASFLNPLYPGSYNYYYYDDKNKNGLADPGEVLIGLGPALAPNRTYNPFNPGVALQSNRVDSGLSAPTTDEVLLSAEHSFLPEFVVGVNLTYRKLNNLLQTTDLVFDGSDAFSAANVLTVGRPATRNDYVAHVRTGVLPNGQTYSFTTYEVKSGLSSRGGSFLFNSNNSQTYKGASLNFNKRLANRWMLRGNFNVQDWKWNVNDGALPDPTHFLPGGLNGDDVLQGSGTGSGSKGAVYINSKWSYNVNGLYQFGPDRPWGFNAALNATGRQGYPDPYFRRVTQPNKPGFEYVLIPGGPDKFRNADVHVLDGRIEKEFTFSDFGMTIGVDCFNMLNESYVLQRQVRLNSAKGDHVLEILSPRIFRLGARFSFR